MAHCNFYLPDELLTAIREAIRDRDMNVSQWLRAAIREKLARDGR
jgi:post-segregation antitoxin (ccd killing protein)